MLMIAQHLTGLWNKKIKNDGIVTHMQRTKLIYCGKKYDNGGVYAQIRLQIIRRTKRTNKHP